MVALSPSFFSDEGGDELPLKGADLAPVGEMWGAPPPRSLCFAFLYEFTLWWH